MHIRIIVGLYLQEVKDIWWFELQHRSYLIVQWEKFPLLILDDVAITRISRSKNDIHISIKNQSEYFYHVNYHNTEWNYVGSETKRKLPKNRVQKMIGRSIIHSNHLTKSIFRRIHHYVMNGFDFNLDSLRSLDNQYRNIWEHIILCFWWAYKVLYSLLKTTRDWCLFNDNN